jgi:PAS domain S-box-containing protein
LLNKTEELLDRLREVLLEKGRTSWLTLLGVLFAVLVPILLLEALSYIQSHRHQTNLALAQRHNLAQLAANTLAEKFDRLTDLGVSLASGAHFAQLVNEGKWYGAALTLTNVSKNFPFIDRTFIADTVGTLMADNPALPGVRGKNFADRDWYRGVTGAWQPYISEVYQRAAEPRHNVIAAATPIKNPEGRSVGILVLQVKLDSLLEWTKDFDVGASSTILIVDKSGIAAAGPKHDPQGALLGYSSHPAVEKALHGASGIGEFFHSQSNERQLIAYHPVGEYRWAVLIQQPARAAFAERDRNLRLLSLAYGFIAVLGLALAYLIVRSMMRLKQSEVSCARLAAVVDYSDDAIITKALDGTIVTWNRSAEKVYGYAAEEAIGRSIALVIPPECASELEEILVEIRAGRVVERDERARRRKDGREIYVSLSVSPIRDGAGNIIGASAISRDITVQKQLREELVRKNRELEQQNRLVQEANRLKGEFLANMSHELRTPLNAIIGFAQLMHDGKVGQVSANHKEYLGDILASAKHLLQLINDVLDLSKVEAGKLELVPARVDPEIVVTEVRDIVRSLAAKKRITMHTEIDPSLVEIVTDEKSLKQILYNYLSNAIKFTLEEGRVTVRLKPEGAENFRLEVEDDGIGIKAEDLGRLFVEFQQLEAGSGKNYPGTGLGLAVTRRIVEAQGGQVGVASEPGKGSTFYAILPRALRLAGKTVEESKRAANKDGPPVILVVEDDANDRAWIAREIKAAGYAVVTVATGAEALLRCRGQHFDAITLDIMLPDMNGRDLLEKLRQQRLNHDTPVVVVTVLAHKGVVAGFEVADILSKPVSEGEILRALKRCGVEMRARQPILVVDDDASSLKLAAKTLRNLGYRPLCRQDAKSALKAASEELPAAVVLDLIMPEINGFEFLKRFRRVRRGRQTPVIVWTGKDLTESERAELRAAGNFITKKDDEAGELILELKNVLQSASRCKDLGAVTDRQ